MLHILLAWIALWIGWLWAPQLLPVAFVPLLWMLFRLERKQFWVLPAFFGLLFLAMSWWILGQNPAVALQWIVFNTLAFSLAFGLPRIISERMGLQRGLLILPFFVVLGDGALSLFDWNFIPVGSQLNLGIGKAAVSASSVLLWLMFSNVFAYLIIRSYWKNQQIRPLIGQSLLWIFVLILIPHFIAQKTAPICDVNDASSSMYIVENRGVLVPEIFMQPRAHQLSAERCSPVVYVNSDGFVLLFPGTAETVPLSGNREQYAFVPADFGYLKYGFALRISFFMSVFMLLYFVSFSLRNHQYGKPQI